MVNKKRLQEVLDNKEALKMMIKIWDFLPKTFRNEVQTAHTIKLFHKILLALFPNVSEQIAADYVNEQLFIIKYSSAQQNLIAEDPEADSMMTKSVLLDRGQESQEELKSTLSEPKQEDNLAYQSFLEDPVKQYPLGSPLIQEEENMNKGILNEENFQEVRMHFLKMTQQDFFLLLAQFFM